MNYVYNEAKSFVPSTLVVSVFYCSPSNTFLRLLYERFFICMPLHKSLYKKLKLIFCTSVVLRTEPPDKPLIYFISLFLFQKSAKNVIGLHVFCLRATIPLQAQQYTHEVLGYSSSLVWQVLLQRHSLQQIQTCN